MTATKNGIVPGGQPEVRINWGVRIPLRDGVHLSATVYIPESSTAPSPCLLTVTPYISDTAHDRAMYLARKGYPIACVDSRGRGNSEGEFRAFLQEARDGYDVVEWLARQSYCNGQVGMLGGSYCGYNQWAVAKEFPPHLVTIVPAAAAFPGVDFPMRNSIFSPYVIQWLTLTAGHAAQQRIFVDHTYWSTRYRRWHESGKPFCELDTMVGDSSPTFQEWLQHPEPDDYWDAYNPSDQEYASLQLPILTITGSYDDDQPGALEHYRRHLRLASSEASARHYLVIGPWDHAGTRAPRLEFGGLKFASASQVDLERLHLEWYAWTMLDGPRPAFLHKRVAYYVMGEERWRYADTLDEVTSSHRPYYLDSAGSASDVFASGSLGPVPGTGPADSYSYDPADNSGPEIEAEAAADGGSLTDQKVLFALRGRQLIYHSAPVPEDLEISGFFKLSVWLSINCPDTDLYVSIHEIAIDGSSIRLSTDALRARYREGPRKPELVQTREPLRYDFTRFTFVSRKIKRGHRLRLVLAPIGRLIESTFAEKNYNRGGVVAEESAAQSRAVTVSLSHDADRPSVLHVPIGMPESLLAL